jgi:hypothetical protein
MISVRMGREQDDGNGDAGMRHQPGWTGHCNGFRHGARDRLAAMPLALLREDVAKYGAAALRRLRIYHPASYLRFAAAQLRDTAPPGDPFADVGDEELVRLIAAARAALAAQQQQAAAALETPAQSDAPEECAAQVETGG